MTITIYCLIIASVSLLGGYLPLSKTVTHLSLQVYLSLSAGAMLGAACFHMLPGSVEYAGQRFGGWMALGVIGLYVIERFLSPHSHDTTNPKDTEPEPHLHGSLSRAVLIPEPHPAAPQVAGWSAVAGLSIHTLLGGVALGSAVLGQQSAPGLGLAVFLATVLHKPADALTISTLLIKGGTSRKRALIVQCFFALLIPLGVLLFYVGKSVSAAHVDATFTGCVLAFSAGTFICIALSDLLPEVQFHSHDRGRLFLAVILGALLMWATALIEPEDAHAPSPAQPRSGQMATAFALNRR